MSSIEIDRRRDFNEDRRRLFGETSPEIAFVCECSDPECRTSVVLSPADYDARRELPPYLLLHDLHAAPLPPQ